MAHQAGLILAHLAGNLVHYLINGGIHIITLRAGFERDVIAAMQNHLGNVAVFFDVQNYLDFDDFRIVKVKASQTASAIFLHGIRYTHVPPSHLDWWICILNLHNGALSFLAAANQRSCSRQKEQELRHRRQEPVLAQAGYWSQAVSFFGYIRKRSPR